MFSKHKKHENTDFILQHNFMSNIIFEKNLKLKNCDFVNSVYPSMKNDIYVFRIYKFRALSRMFRFDVKNVVFLINFTIFYNHIIEYRSQD